MRKTYDMHRHLHASRQDAQHTKERRSGKVTILTVGRSGTKPTHTVKLCKSPTIHLSRCGDGTVFVAADVLYAGTSKGQLHALRFRSSR